MAGDVIRRLVRGTMAQQLSKAVETATAPHQWRDVNVWPTFSKASPKRTPMPPSLLLVV